MSDFIKNILLLPDKTLTNTTLTKQFFYKNFDLSSQEKKIFRTSIIEMRLLATISESSANITSVVSESETFENIFVVTVQVTAVEFRQRDVVATTIQKYFPYHCLVFVENQEEFIVSSALKRVNKNDSTKRVIEDEVVTPVISKLVSGEIQNHFFSQMSFKSLDKTNLETLYKDYFSSIVNYKSSIAVSKIINHSKVRTKENIDTLQEIDELELKITNLDNLIKNENRTNVVVELNTKRYHLKTEITELKMKLTIK